MNKKLAIVYQYSPLNSIGGGENRLYEIFKRFKDFEIDWFCQFIEKNQKIDNINFISLSKRKLQKRSYRETLEWIYLMRQIPVQNYDAIIIGQMPFFNIPILQIKCDFYRIPYVIDYWEYWGPHWNKFNFIISKVGKVIEKMILKNASNITVISQNVFSKLNYLYPNKNIFYVPNGINFHEITQIRPNYKYDFVYFGRLEKHKRVDRSILVFNELLKFNNSFRLAIIGNGSEKNNLKLLVKKLNIEDKVDFLGILDNNDMFSFIKGAKFFLFFSEQEGGSSLAVLESNACGTPVVHVVSPNGLDKDLFSNNNGLLFEKFDEENIALNIIKYLKNKIMYDKLKNNSIEFAKNYDWNNLVFMCKNYIKDIVY